MSLENTIAILMLIPAAFFLAMTLAREMSELYVDMRAIARATDQSIWAIRYSISNTRLGVPRQFKTHKNLGTE